MLSNQQIGFMVEKEPEWSGSGSGVPQLLQRTIARQIKLAEPCIGKGRFGEVYRGMWRDEHVAVKTFNSADERSWQTECAIYNTSGFRHENILGFIAADNIDRGTYTELWLITEYHAHGSLYDFLSRAAAASLDAPPSQSLRAPQCLRMCLSIANGLDHLHTAIESCTGKPALAHCDLKSKNILVKADLSCCIGDLGLALCGDKMGNVRDADLLQTSATGGGGGGAPSIRTGTKRYMAPEILAKTLNARSLHEYQSAEMYSLALVFWEVIRRCVFEIEQPQAVGCSSPESSIEISDGSNEISTASSSGVSSNLPGDSSTSSASSFSSFILRTRSAPLSASSSTMSYFHEYEYEYQMPYYEFVGVDPDEAQMRQIVCDEKRRPEMNPLWYRVPLLREMTRLTEELWCENASGRLNALRLKKSLNLLRKKYAAF